MPPALVRPGAAEQFCCDGCRLVHGTLAGAGLGGDYYALRSSFGSRSDSAPSRATGRSYAAFDRESFRDQYVRPVEGTGLSEMPLLLEGVHCAACVWLVERLGVIVPGIAESRLAVRDSQVVVRFDPERTSPSAIASGLDSLGYPAHPARRDEGRRVAREAERRHLMRIGVAAVCAGNAMLVAFALYSATGEASIEPGHAALFRWTGMALGWLAILWPGRGFLEGAWAAIRTRRPNLDLPIAIALGAGALVGSWHTVLGTGEAYFDSLTVLVFLLVGGRYVQARQQRWAADAVDLTRALTPSICRVQRGGRMEEITIDELEEGDLAEVRPGEPVPGDGTVIDGRSSVDRSLLSGEAEPVSVGTGDELHAGCVNLSGRLLVRITDKGLESRVGRIMDLVHRGLSQKPPIERFTDRIAGVFVGVVCVAASATFLYWSVVRGETSAALDHTVALLIVACPCALGLATPLSLAVAVGRAAGRGLLVKDAAVFERLAGRGALVLDKTGTVTRGRAQLVRWTGAAELRPATHALEANSNHPVAEALRRGLAMFAEPDLVATGVEERLNGGLLGTVAGRRVRVGSLIHLERHGAQLSPDLVREAEDAASRGSSLAGVTIEGSGEVSALAELRDVERDDAAPTISAMQSTGWSVELLSGDGQAAVDRTASAVGIQRAQGSVEPEAKLARIEEIQRTGATAVMVGDGVNDAAALAAADVGIAVHGGAEISLAAADVYSSREGLEPVLWLTNLAKRAMDTIRTNLGVSLVYNVVGVSLAAAGLMDPLLAAILMPISSATVLTLAMVLLRLPVGRRGPAEPRPWGASSRSQEPMEDPCP